MRSGLLECRRFTGIILTSSPMMKHDENSIDRWDRLLAKYTSVWIWSILFGASTGLAFSFLTLDRWGDWGRLSILPSAIASMAAIMLLFSWYLLYRYLCVYILPCILFPNERNAHEIRERGEHASWIIQRAFLSLLVAVLIRAVASLMIAVMNAAG